MKLLITPYIEGFPNQTQVSPQISFENLINALKSASIQNSGQTIELQDGPLIQAQIDSTLDNFDIDNLLDPTMPNTGGMEIMASIKQQLRLQLESILFSQKIEP